MSERESLERALKDEATNLLVAAAEKGITPRSRAMSALLAVQANKELPTA